MGKLSIPATDYARELDQVFGIFIWICGALLVAITLAMIYFAWRYRRSATSSTTQIHGNLPLEITWTIIPTIIVMYMFYLGYAPFIYMRTVPPDAMIIKVTASKWEWKFEYPDHGLQVIGTRQKVVVTF